MAIVRQIEVSADTSEVNKSTEKLVEALKDLTKAFGGIGKEAEEASEKVDKIEKSGKKAGSGLGFVKNGFKAIGTAIKAAGIGLVIGLFVALKDIVESNQKVLDFFSVTMDTVTILFNEVTDALVSAYDSVVDATGGFDALGKVMKGILT